MLYRTAGRKRHPRVRFRFAVRAGAKKSPRFGQGAKCALRLARARKHTRAIRRANRAGADACLLAQAPARIMRELGFRRSGKPGGGENGMEWNETG